MIQRRGRIAAFHWPLPASGTITESALCRDAALLPVPPAGGAALWRQRCGTTTPAALLHWKGGRERKRPKRVGRSACARRSYSTACVCSCRYSRSQSECARAKRKAQMLLVCVCAGRFIRSRTKRARAREARRVCVRTLNGNLRAGLLFY